MVENYLFFTRKKAMLYNNNFPTIMSVYLLLILIIVSQSGSLSKEYAFWSTYTSTILLCFTVCEWRPI